MTYFPDLDTRLTAKQLFGLSPARLNDVVAEYVSAGGMSCHDAFLRYCQSLSSESEVLTLPGGWQPLSFCVGQIPQNIVQHEYYPQFVTFYRGRRLHNGDYTLLFESFCELHWESDSRNPDTNMPTFMTMEWVPNEETRSTLNLLRMNDEAIEVAIAEFKLYHRDAGSMRSDWNACLRDWFCIRS